MSLLPAISNEWFIPSAFHSKCWTIMHHLPKVPVAILPFPKSMVSECEQAIAPGLLSHSKTITRHGPARGIITHKLKIC